MSRLREFKRKLDEIQRRRAGEASAPAARRPSCRESPRWSPLLDSVLTRASRLPPVAVRESRREPLGLQAACPGEARELEGLGSCYLMEEADPAWQEMAAALREAVGDAGSALRERLARSTGVEDFGAEDLLFLDIETTGLASTPLFLIGTLVFQGGRLAIRQHLARDYAEERAVLGWFARAMSERRMLVSFNGKSFDLPYVKVRLSYHRAPSLPERPHFDVLLEARRIWRGTVPDCRLKTLEEAICGRRRDGDIDGADIPEAYHRFVRTQDAREIACIVSHNRMDLLTMAELMLRMPAP